MTTMQTTQYQDGTTTTVTTTTTTTSSSGGMGGEANSSTKTMGIVELAISAACAVLAIATIVFSWVYLDARLTTTALATYNAQCKSALGQDYLGQICQATPCAYPSSFTSKPTSCLTTLNGDAMYCGKSGSVGKCMPCPYNKVTTPVEGKNYNKVTLVTNSCNNVQSACKEYCQTALDYNSGTTQAACELYCAIVDSDLSFNQEACKGRVTLEIDGSEQTRYRKVSSCPGYPWAYDYYTDNAQNKALPTTAPSYDGNKNLLICGRPMYAAVCYAWDDPYQITGITSAAVPVDTSPIGLMKNYKWAGGVPSTIGASLALLVSIPSIINGLMAMQSNEGGVKATGGLAIGLSIVGFCSSMTCLIIVCVFAGVSEAMKWMFAIFNAVIPDSEFGGTCPINGACYKSVQEQTALSGTVAYYFRVLSFMNGFMFAISILQAIFAVVICCAYKRQGQ